MSRVHLLAALGLGLLVACAPTVPDAPEEEGGLSLERQEAALESYSTTVYWGGASTCATCGSAQYACSDGTGNWNGGSQSFADPVPAGGVVVGVQVAVYGRGWDGGHATVLLNGVALGTYSPPSYSLGQKLDCAGCDAVQNVNFAVASDSAGGVPGYRYGALNTLTLATSATNCVARATVTLTVATPALSVSASRLDFGLQRAGSASTQAVTLSNSGAGTLVLKSASTSAPFSIHSGPALPASLLPGASVTVTVQFQPPGEGSYAGVLTLASNDASNATVRIPLQGSGGGAALALSPSSLDFGSLPVKGSVSKTLLVQNTGSLALTVQSVTVEPPFSVTGVPSGGFTVQPGASQVLTVGFSPQAPGSFPGTLYLLSNSSNLPAAQVPLSGSGAAPSLVVRPGSASFGFQAVGAPSAPQVMTVFNEGLEELVISDIEATGPFQVRFSEKPLHVAPGRSQNLEVTFTPEDAGSASGTLTLTSNDPDTSPLAVDLSGTGVGESLDVKLSTPGGGVPVALLDFGTTQHVGTSSNPQVLTLSNTGPAPLTLHSAQTAAPFVVSPTTRVVLAPGASTPLAVVFEPTLSTDYQGKLVLTADGPGASTVSLDLMGTGASPALVLQPREYTFANQAVGTASATPQSVSVQNTGSGAATLQTVAVQGPFTVSGFTPGSSLAANATSTFQVSFTPTAPGPATGKLLLYSDSPTSPLVMKLAGTGVQAIASLEPQAVDFGGQRQATSSAPSTVTLTNTGNAALSITAATVTGPFTLAGLPLPINLESGKSVPFQVTFNPVDAKLVTGGVVLMNDKTPLAAVALSGTGTTAQFSVQPAQLSFASQPLGTTGHRPVVLTNTGTGSITLQTALLPAGFSLSGLALPQRLAPGALLNFQVAFKPTSATDYAGSLLLLNDSSTPLELALTGSGVAAAVTLTPATVSLGNQRVGTSGAPQTVELANSGAAPLRILRFSVAAPFAVSGLQAPLTLAPGEKTTFQVSFAPSSTGPSQGQVVLTTDAPQESVVLPLGGAGVTSYLTVDTSSLSFGTQRVGVASAARTVTVSNIGNAALTVARLESTNEAYSVDSSGLAAPIPAGGSATFTVAFKPGAEGAAHGEVRLYPEGSGPAVVLAVDGSGTNAGLEGGGCAAGGGGAGMLLGLLVLGAALSRTRLPRGLVP